MLNSRKSNEYNASEESYNLLKNPSVGIHTKHCALHVQCVISFLCELPNYWCCLRACCIYCCLAFQFHVPILYIVYIVQPIFISLFETKCLCIVGIWLNINVVLCLSYCSNKSNAYFYKELYEHNLYLCLYVILRATYLSTPILLYQHVFSTFFNNYFR